MTKRHKLVKKKWEKWQASEKKVTKSDKWIKKCHKKWQTSEKSLKLVKKKWQEKTN